MAIINKTGISNGGTIQAEHVTRVIDALSGVSTDTLILSGSMTGSLIGTLTGTASFATSASRAVSALSSSFATTASYALNGGGGSTFPYNGNAVITGSLTVSGSSSDVILRTRITSISASISTNVTAPDIRLTGTSTIALNGDAGTTSWAADSTSQIDWRVAGSGGDDGQLNLPLQATGAPRPGAIYWDNDAKVLNIWDGASWKTVNLT